MSLLVDVEADAEQLRLADDAELLARSRDGDCLAFAELFLHYRRVARRVAAQTSSVLDPEDVCAEAFLRVWRALRNGGGPSQAFGAYLSTSVRNVALNWCRAPREVPIEPQTLAIVLDDRGDSGVALAQIGLISRAFRTLPQRWQDALWATEVEGVTISELAARLGTSNNAASALCLRARDGLRKAWLRLHMERNRDPRRPTH